MSGSKEALLLTYLVMGAVRSVLNFGPVVKPLGITVKKEVGKVVETSDVVRTQTTREFRKRGQKPQSPKRPQKGGPKNLPAYLLTPWSRVLLEKLTGSAASQEIPRIFGTRRFITVLTSARHLSLS